MRMLLMLTATLLTAACGANELSRAAAGGPIIIEDNRGGNVVEMIALRRDLHNEGPVEIHGMCNSACTILASLDNVCLDADATFGFHGASTGPIPNPVGSAALVPFYRNGILRKFLRDWQFQFGDDATVITAQEFVRRDPETKICEVTDVD